MTGSRDEWRFGDVTIETATFRVLRGGVPMHMEPRALEVLLYLIERRDRIVTKQELLDALWKGVAVTENALTRAVAQIRKTLGDDLESPRYIQTVPTRGYRFVAAVEDNVGPASANGPSLEPAGSRRLKPAPRRAWILPAILAILAVFGVLTAGLIAVDKARISQKQKSSKPRPFAKSQKIVAGRPLRPDTRLQAHPAFSPDGTTLAYSVDVDGTPHIFTAPLEGGEQTQITRGDGETQPSWSPDGKWIAYVSVRGGGIWVTPLTGDSPRQLTSGGSRPSWSPDGNEIAFQSSEIMEYGWTAFEALPPSNIQIVHLKTGRIEALTKPGQPAGGHGAPSWRSDGRRLAFSSCDIERCAIFTVARDGSSLSSIMKDGRRLASPLFSPDGSSVHFILGRYNTSALLSAPVDDNAQLTGPAGRLRETNPGVMQHLAMSRDGRRFAWTLAEEASNLFSVRADGRGEPVRLTRNPTMRATFPSFSPDGSKIAWSAIAAGEDGGVWVMDADGRNPKPVAVGAGLKQHIGWKRSGWDVVYAAWDEGPAIVQASLINGTTSVIFRPPGDASAPVIAPDGETFAFNRTIGGVASVWKNEKRLTTDHQLARFPVWSPSGRLLAVQVRGAEGSAVGITDAEGGSLKIIEKGRGESQPYSFSPDERFVAFAGRRDGVWNIYTARIDGSSTRRLTSNRSMTNWVRSPAWSPAGDQIVFEAGVPHANVWVSQ